MSNFAVNSSRSSSQVLVPQPMESPSPLARLTKIANIAGREIAHAVCHKLVKEKPSLVGEISSSVLVNELGEKIATQQAKIDNCWFGKSFGNWWYGQELSRLEIARDYVIGMESNIGNIEVAIVVAQKNPHANFSELEEIVKSQFADLNAEFEILNHTITVNSWTRDPILEVIRAEREAVRSDRNWIHRAMNGLDQVKETEDELCGD